MIDDLIPTARSSEMGLSQDRENHGCREKQNPALITPKSNRSGRATSSPTPVNTTVLPAGGPSSDDCYTTLLHNPDHDLGSSSGKPSGKQPGDCVRFVL